MLKTPKYVVPLFALAIVLPLAASAVSIAASVRFAESGMATQRGTTIMGDKTTARRQLTHSVGALAVRNPNALRLTGPALRESGMGRLVGGDTLGDRNTPKRNPTFTATPR